MSLTVTPRLLYDESSGYLILSDGKRRQVVARPDGMTIWLWWKFGKCEYPVTLEEIVAALEDAQS
jgi:hypothetical protein